MGSAADNEKKCPVMPVIKLLRQEFPKLLVGCDVCLCAWTAHGHCGIASTEFKDQIDNEATVQRLAEIAVAYAKIGCQIIAPSDMMDGRILAIKNALFKKKLGSQVRSMLRIYCNAESTLLRITIVLLGCCVILLHKICFMYIRSVSKS